MMVFAIVSIFALLWVFIAAPIMLAIPKGVKQKWLEDQYLVYKIWMFVFWPYFLIKSYSKG